jgi:hypothetical protein
MRQQKNLLVAQCIHDHTQLMGASGGMMPISPPTVATYLERISGKIGVEARGGIKAFAVRTIQR